MKLCTHIIDTEMCMKIFVDYDFIFDRSLNLETLRIYSEIVGSTLEYHKTLKIGTPRLM